MKKRTKKYPKGHFIGLGIAIGAPMGIPLWLVIGNPGMIAIGIAVGVAIGAAMESEAKKKGQIRALTKKERADRKRLSWIGIAIGALLFLVLLSVFFMVK